MEFSPEHFEGEEREGFYIQPLMKRVWAVELEILEEIKALCRRHAIRFSAVWGTLLGAVRHQGFIPWDDDIDLVMLREDLVRFLHYARTELPPGYCIHDYNNEGFDELLVCVVNTHTLNLNVEFLEKFHGCPYSIGIDIFCMDHIPPNKEEEEVLLNLLSVTDNLGCYWDTYAPEERAEYVREIEQLTNYHFDENRPVRKQMLYLADKISAMYWDVDCEEATFMYLLRTAPHYRLPISCFDRIIEVPFENTTMPILEDYDRLLRLSYGNNYMTPVKKWNSHKYPFFRNQIKRLRALYEKRGMKIPACFDMELDES